MIVHAGIVSRIALFLGASFSVHGLIRKRLAMGPVAGLFLECLFAMPLALVLFWYVERIRGVAFGRAGVTIDILLLLTGFVTALPLWLFTVAAKHLRLATIGMLQ